jgi:hypothetical protein
MAAMAAALADSGFSRNAWSASIPVMDANNFSIVMRAA